LAPQHVAGSMRIRRFALCWKGNPSFNRVEQILGRTGADATRQYAAWHLFWGKSSANEGYP
jgi:hypothetical protein